MVSSLADRKRQIRKPQFISWQITSSQVLWQNQSRQLPF
jgi:hypothetical protein